MPPDLPDVPLCPFHALTGLHCPLCGSTRAVWHLLHADVPAALHANVLLFAALAWLATRRHAPPVPVIAGALGAFAVARNLPGLDSYLAPPA